MTDQIPTAQEYRDMLRKVEATLHWAVVAEREGKISQGNLLDLSRLLTHAAGLQEEQAVAVSWIRESVKVKAQVATLEQELSEREQQLAEARTFGEAAAEKYNALLAERQSVTCAFCGQEYPQGTPRHGDGALTEHIATCEQHPMRGLERQLADAGIQHSRAFDAGRTEAQRHIDALRDRAETAERQIAAIRGRCSQDQCWLGCLVPAADIMAILDAPPSDFQGPKYQCSEDVIQDAVGHWFIQGGKAQFGMIEATNTDELIAQILHLVRLKCPSEIDTPPSESTR
jgi:hypothetical protein